MHPDSTLPTPAEDTPEQLLADLAADPATQDILKQQLHEEAVAFVASCLSFALRIKHSPDVWTAKRVLIDARIWINEAKGRMDKEISAHSTPTTTTGAFRR